MTPNRDSAGRFTSGGTTPQGFAANTSKKLQNFRRAVTIKCFNAVILDTPVDTGRARANWRVSEGTPELKEADRVDKTGGVSMREVEVLVTASRGDKPVFLANNLPYIEPLEYGWSRQAPQGMVRRNVARFQALVRRHLGMSVAG